MRTSIQPAYPMSLTQLLGAVCACLLVVAFGLAAIPHDAGSAQTKAEKAFADWKAAQAAVAAAKEKLANAQKALQNAMTAVAKSGGKPTAAEEAALEQGRAAVAAAEAALREAEKQELAARVALEKEITELPDGPLKDRLKRERNYPSIINANGLYTVKFDTPSGQVTVNLPDDMRAGDTISGTLIAEPKGQTPDERAKNTTGLSGYLIELELPNKPDGTASPRSTTQVRAERTPFTFTLPPTAANLSSSNSGLRIALTSAALNLPDPNTMPVFIQPLTLHLQSVPPKTFQLATIGQQGRTLSIPGPFDGNAGNTTLLFRSYISSSGLGEPVADQFAIAESPRRAVFISPTNLTGAAEISLKEGNVETKGTYRNVGVNLSAPKTSLLRGERTDVTIEVTGLQGIKEPVPLQLDATGVITMDGGNFQNLRISPTEIKQDGRYTTTRPITGQQAGVFNVTATVTVGPFNACLLDDNVPKNQTPGNYIGILFNTFTGDYSFRNIGPAPAAAGQVMPAGKGPISLTGTGKPVMKGCIITLQHNAPDRRVFARLDTCSKSGDAKVETTSPKTNVTITDRNITNNACSPE